jgi:hypothetical protein
MPVLLPTVAIGVAPLLHVPPVVASLKVVVKPTHTLAVPETGNGVTLTVKTVVVIQLVGKV